MRCKLAWTLAFVRSMIFNTKNAIVLPVEQARTEYGMSHAYLRERGKTLNISRCHQGSLDRVSMPRAMQALCDVRRLVSSSRSAYTKTRFWQ